MQNLSLKIIRQHYHYSVNPLVANLFVFDENFVLPGWTNRLWGICCHDEKGQWRDWKENHDKHT